MTSISSAQNEDRRVAIDPFLMFHPEIAEHSELITLENAQLSPSDWQLRHAINRDIYGHTEGVSHAVQLLTPATIRHRLGDTLHRFAVHCRLNTTECWPHNRDVLLGLVPSLFALLPHHGVHPPRRTRSNGEPPFVGTISFDQLNLGYSTQWKYTFGWPSVISDTLVERSSLDDLVGFDFGNGQHYPHDDLYGLMDSRRWVLNISWERFRWFKHARCDDVRNILASATYQLIMPTEEGTPQTRWFRTEVFRSYHRPSTPYRIHCPGLFAESAPELVRVVRLDANENIATGRWHPELSLVNDTFSSGIPLVMDGPVISVSRYFVGRDRRSGESRVVDDTLRFCFCRADGSLIGIALQRVDYEATHRDWRTTTLARHLAKIFDCKHRRFR